VTGSKYKSYVRDKIEYKDLCSPEFLANVMNPRTCQRSHEQDLQSNGL